MPIRVKYNRPKYSSYRELCGINTWRTVRYPDGYKTQIIDADDENDLRVKIQHRTFNESHDHKGRPLTLNDLKLVEWT
jgi:hypothetical protein